MSDILIQLKENSHKLILDTIRKEQGISGADLSRRTNLQPSTILYILRALQKDNLIRKCGKGISTEKGGKRPTLWKLNEEKGLIIGIEVLPERIISSITNFAGDIIKKTEKAYQHFNKENEMLEAILKTIRDIVKENKNIPIIGVGIAITGIVDGERGELIYSNKMQFNNVLIKDYIEKKSNLPVFVINGANAGALQVQWFDNNIVNNIIYLTYSDDVLNLGAGLVINRSLYEGASGTSGEMFNKLPFLKDLYLDAIKHVKTEEPLVQEINKNKTKLKFELINKYYLEKCKVSEYIMQSLFRFIVSEIIWIIGFVNPEIIVLGGDVDSNTDVIDRYIMTGIRKFIKENEYKDYIIPYIQFSKYGRFSISMGAIALIWQKIIQN